MMAENTSRGGRSISPDAFMVTTDPRTCDTCEKKNKKKRLNNEERERERGTRIEEGM